MKRVSNLYPELISRENIERAIDEVNITHRYYKHHRPNRTVIWVESHKEEVIEKLIYIIENGYEPAEPKISKRYDKSACKWRDIAEPKIYPDQYIHHALIQVLQPIMMRGMDYWCCGSIKGRGIHYGVKAIKRWVNSDSKNARYCLEMDVKHFYNNLNSKVVIDRLRHLIKDRKVLLLSEQVLSKGVLIGAYTSQWFANTTLQPLDALIRQQSGCKHYLRYMDNFTVFGSNKRALHKIRKVVSEWLESIGLELKSNWQVFPIKCRSVQALGYRYTKGKTNLRKRNLLRMKRQLHRIAKMQSDHVKIPAKVASGILSRIGQLTHCDHNRFYELYIPKRFQLKMKRIVRLYMKGERLLWSTYMDTTESEKSSKPLAKSILTYQGALHLSEQPI